MEQLRSNQAQNNPEKRPGRLRLPMDKASRYDFSDIYDKEEWSRERDDISIKLNEAGQNIKPHVNRMEEKDYTTWQTLAKKQGQFLSIRQSVYQAFQGKEELFYTDLLYLMEATRSFLAFKILDRLHPLAKKYGFLGHYEPFAELEKFTLAGATGVKIAGVSVKDIMDNQNISPASSYKFFVEANVANSKKDHAKIIQENQTPLMTAYPNSTKQSVDDAIHHVVAFQISELPSVLELEQLASQLVFRGASREHKEFLRTAVQIAKRINSLRQNIFNTILDPNSPDFPPLMEVAEDYLSQEDQELRVDAILQLGLNSNKNIVSAYRKAKELSQQNNEYSSFYNLLQRSIIQHIEEVPQEIGIFTSDDLPLFIDTDKLIQEESVPTLEDLRKITGSIFQRSPQREYVVDKERASEISSITPPNSIRVEFTKGHANIFNIYFYYENEQGESTILELNFDTRKNVFDWKPFIENTDDPEMKQLRVASLIAAQSILSNINQYVEDEYQQKQQEREAGTQTQRPAQSTKIRSDEPYVPRQKEQRQERPRPLTPIQEILQSEMPIFAQPKGIKNEIVLPEDQYLFDVMKGLAPSDQKEIVEGMQNYNENGVGAFRMLKALGNEGQRLYALRVNCGPRGGSRVLLQESDPEETLPNTRKFQIVDIGYRKDIYRKRGL